MSKDMHQPWQVCGNWNTPSFYITDENEITYHDKLWEFAPGWVLAHGDEGNIFKASWWDGSGSCSQDWVFGCLWAYA